MGKPIGAETVDNISCFRDISCGVWKALLIRVFVKILELN